MRLFGAFGGKLLVLPLVSAFAVRFQRYLDKQEKTIFVAIIFTDKKSHQKEVHVKRNGDEVS